MPSHPVCHANCVSSLYSPSYVMRMAACARLAIAPSPRVLLGKPFSCLSTGKRFRHHTHTFAEHTGMSHPPPPLPPLLPMQSRQPSTEELTLQADLFVVSPLKWLSLFRDTFVETALPRGLTLWSRYFVPRFCRVARFLSHTGFTDTTTRFVLLICLRFGFCLPALPARTAPTGYTAAWVPACHFTLPRLDCCYAHYTRFAVTALPRAHIPTALGAATPHRPFSLPPHNLPAPSAIMPWQQQTKASHLALAHQHGI